MLDKFSRAAVTRDWYIQSTELMKAAGEHDSKLASEMQRARKSSITILDQDQDMGLENEVGVVVGPVQAGRPPYATDQFKKYQYLWSDQAGGTSMERNVSDFDRV